MEKGNSIDLIGFMLAHSIGLILILRACLKRRLRLLPVVFGFTSISYTALIVYLTAEPGVLKSLLISRVGILNWFLLGLGVAGMLDIFDKIKRHSQSSFIRNLLSFSILLSAAFAMSFVLEYRLLSIPEARYQPMAYNIMAFILIQALAIEAVYGSDKSAIVLFVFCLRLCH